MATPAERDAERQQFLLAFYEMTNGDTMDWHDFTEVGESLGLDEQTADRLTRYWMERSCLEMHAMGGLTGITARGVDEAERMLRDAALLAQAAPVLSIVELRAVESFLTTYRRSVDEGELDGLGPEDRAEVDAEIATIEAQQKSPKPKRRIVKYALENLHAILIGAAGSGAAVGISKLLSML